MHKVIDDMGGAGDQSMKDVFLFQPGGLSGYLSFRAGTDGAFCSPWGPWSRMGVGVLY